MYLRDKFVLLMYASCDLCVADWLLPVWPPRDRVIEIFHLALVGVDLVMVCIHTQLHISNYLWIGLAQQHTAVVGVDMVLVHLQYTQNLAVHSICQAVANHPALCDVCKRGVDTFGSQNCGCGRSAYCQQLKTHTSVRTQGDICLLHT